MPTPKLSLTQRTNLDQESRAMLYFGASVNQLSEIFGLREADCLKKLAGLPPSAQGRQGNPLWRIRDAAPRLIRIEITPDMIDDYMKRANPKDFPAQSNKMYWDAMLQQLKYKEIVGELWYSEDVAGVARQVFQSLRMSMLLIPDMLMAETTLTERQLHLVQNVIDNALEETREKLVEELRKPSREDALAAAEDDEL